MSRKILVTLILCIFFVSAFNSNSLAWDNEVTHKDLSKYAAENSALSKIKGDYLVNLGFNNGLDEYFQWSNDKKKIREWLRDGAFYEDAGSTAQGIAGTARYGNHFHNPLKPWPEAGLNDWVLLFHYTGESSLLWSQDSAKQSGWLGGDWTWQATRIYFYNALTKKTDAERQAYFAQTFRGLGHQMHLLQDTSQPDHVRNHAHPADGGGLTTGLETWTKENTDFITCLLKPHNTLPPDMLSKCQQYNISESVNIENFYPTLSTDPPVYTLDPSYYSRNLVPSALFIDTDQYNGTSPSASFSQGLAEYTNANFFSDDTIFTFERYSPDDRHYFPYPRKTSTDISSYLAGLKSSETFTDLDGSIETGTWISKVSDGETVAHLVKSALFSRAIYNIFGEGELFYSLLYREEKCFEDYASLLIARAVGYSAGLLNYFFRGNIAITLPNNGIYSSATATGSGFTRISLLARNSTATGEDMSDETNGSIKLVVRYKLAHQDPFQALDVETDEDFSYIVASEVNNVRNIPSSGAVELNFDLSQNPLPFWATDVYLQVVYHGKLGNEEGAVAVGFKDISEPTPVDFYNNMDKICLNGNWYDAGTQAAIDQAPVWDVFVHDIQGAYLKISSSNYPVYASPSDYTFPVETLSAGQLYRAYVLSDYDYPFNYSDYSPAVPPPTSNDSFDHSRAILTGLSAGSAIKNQVDYQVVDQAVCDEIEETAPCDIRYYPLFYTFRGKNIWGPAGFIVDNPKYPTDTNCSWELLN